MSFFKCEHIIVSFGGLRALDNINLEVNQGEIFSIIGPNGAGKTTLFNCINRFYDINEGEILFKDKDISRIRPYQVAELGISRTFQNIELFKNTTVLDNLLLARHRHRRTNLITETLFSKTVRRQEVASREKAEEIIDFLEIEAYRDKIVASLPYGIQKIVELGRALTMGPELLLLDEPSSGMNIEESEDLTHWLTDIKEDLGITILVVEHNMRLVMDISDRVLALNFGKVISEGPPKDVQDDPEVIKAYLGE